MPYTGGSNSKRKYRKERQRRMNAEEVLLQCEQVLQRFGQSYSLQEDIPKILFSLLQESQTGVVTTATPRKQVQTSRVEIAFEFAMPDENEFEDEPLIIEASSSGAKEIEEKLPDDVLAQWQAAQDRLLNRVETQGIHYKNNAGPSTGKKLSIHPEAPILSHRTEEIPSPGDDEPVTGSFEDVVGAPGERRNPKTGLTPSEARKILEGALGRKIEAPTPGPRNTLKG